MNPKREELLKHLAASLKDAKEDGGAILLVGAGISVSAGIPPAQKLMKIAIDNFPNYFTEEVKRQSIENLSILQYNDIMSKLSPAHRKEIFQWHIQGNEARSIPKAKLNFAHLTIAELLKQGYIKRILTTNFDPLLINACYMVGMYPLPAIYDLGSVDQINPELFDDPCIIYLNGQHAGQVQRNTSSQLNIHDPILQKVVVSTGCKSPWIVAGYSGENDPLMDALNELRPFNNWLYWLEYKEQVLQKESHQFLENDEECKVIYGCDADSIFLQINKDIECPLSFIEDPSERLQLYIDEIKFNTHQQLGNFYQEFIHDCKKHLERINHSQKLEQHQKFINLVYKILKISDLEGSYNFKERAKPSQYKHLIQERLKNLFTLKKYLLEALESKPNNFWALLNLSHTCLTIYRIQKENNLLSEPSFLQEAENALNKLKTTDEYRNNTNNIISRILYNQACLEALKDNVDSSLNLLEASLKQNQKDTESYFTLRDVETDFDFKNLLMHPKFKELCNQYF
ncbi:MULTISPECIES: SIR2 family protein [Acinetobacter]|uniref:hypothetical protein n=1 Tax=Acinetobacter TaxID=469 RepID=UPI000E356671|nr:MULTISPECIES: hypothetical protein [Acinetobacter]RFS33951.1 hypothetical protein DYI81_04670 [Acinetobacter sp. SWAC5]RKG43922.1 hypothetical protein D7V51_08295 [Acinetobacter cumulans]RZG59701.1 hypothetical protein EXE29_07465 [Acinetobacter sp. WCHAc060006]